MCGFLRNVQLQCRDLECVPSTEKGLNQCFLGWTDAPPEVAFGQREAHSAGC